MAFVGEECEVDNDCVGTLLCYDGDFRWVDTNFSQCDCNSWYGYTGEDCTEIGGAAAVYILSLVLSLGIAFLCVFFSAKTLILVFNLSEHFHKLRRRSSTGLTDLASAIDDSEKPSGRRRTTQFVSNRQKKKTSKFNAMNTTSIFAFLGIIFYLAFRLSQLALLFTPNNIVNRTEAGIEGDAKAHFLEDKVDPVLIILTGVFMSLSVMNLSLVWIDNVRKIQSFTIQNKQKILRYKYLLLVLNVGFSSVVIFSPIAYVTVAIILLLILASVTYIVAVNKLKKLQASFGGDKLGRGSFNAKNYWLEILIQRMVVARRRIVVGTVLAVLGGAFYTITSIENSWREYSPVGYPSAAMAGNELMVFGLGFIQFACIWFLYQSARKPVKSRGKTTKKKSHKRKTSGKVEPLSE